MAVKFKKPSKKATIITVAIIVILLIIAAIGTAVFLRDKGTTEAVDLEQEQQIASETNKAESQTQSEDQNSKETSVANDEGQTTTNEVVTQNEEETQVGQGTNNEETQSTTTQRTNNVGTQTTTSTNTTVDTNLSRATTSAENIQESTITRTETVEIPEKKVAEEHSVGWTHIDINTDLSSALDVQKDDISVEKNAKTETGNNLAQPGEKITYTITVTNNSGKDLYGIEVKDKIPEMTTYQSSDNNAQKVKDGDTIIGLIWNLDITADECTKTVSFTVTVNEDATGTISNLAVANGKKSNETKTSIIKTEKSSVITRNNKNTDVAEI